jgi:hypothetical protein
MPKFLIERHIPGVQTWSPDQLRAVARKSNGVLRDMGPTIQWVNSYVVVDKLFCIYIAEEESLIHQHARLGGFPCTNVTRIDGDLDPTTAES